MLTRKLNKQRQNEKHQQACSARDYVKHCAQADAHQGIYMNPNPKTNGLYHIYLNVWRATKESLNDQQCT